MSVYWLIGGACLFGIWFIWYIGYGMGKTAARRELGRAEVYDQEQKIRAYRNRNKKLAQDAVARAKQH